MSILAQNEVLRLKNQWPVYLFSILFIATVVVVTMLCVQLLNPQVSQLLTPHFSDAQPKSNTRIAMRAIDSASETINQ